jgi:hypothetical protein
MQLDINKTRHGNLRQIIAGIVDTKIRHIHTNFDTTSFISNQISFFFKLKYPLNKIFLYITFFASQFSFDVEEVTNITGIWRTW